MVWYELLLDRWADLVITLTGVFAGAFLAYWAESARAKRQESRERRAEEHRNRQHLMAYLDRAKFEIRENEQTVKQILEKLDRIMQARLDLIQWVAVLGRALSVAAYDDLSRSGLQRLLSEELQSDLFDARQRTVGFRSMLEAAEPAITFYLNFAADQKGADLVLHNLRAYGNTAQQGLERIKKTAFEEAAKLKQTLQT